MALTTQGAPHRAYGPVSQYAAVPRTRRARLGAQQRAPVPDLVATTIGGP
ncbi:hypothetical protein ITI46_07645 [Streptomyces oryzae]|uniref:Uncharacterized protein n=1 Tax=Streptomyces oryzae TaxID=1434886 RepID=A0ABS3X865_9ACTN|nr:hypothetical protein [Streptomyces oryzae]MBO8191565.1 hypothetical protein [Streptomyces oryzae]